MPTKRRIGVLGASEASEGVERRSAEATEARATVEAEDLLARRCSNSDCEAERERQAVLVSMSRIMQKLG